MQLVLFGDLILDLWRIDVDFVVFMASFLCEWETNHICVFFFSMEMKAINRFSVKRDTSVFKRLGRRSEENIARNYQVKSVVCKYWLEGRCARNPCKFLHPNQSKLDNFKSDYVWKNPDSCKQKNLTSTKGKTQLKVVKNKENCDNNRIVENTEQKVLLTSGVKTGETKSRNLHSWFYDNGLSVIARLEGHSKDVTGIVYQSGSTNIYCGSKDKSLRIWDFNSGQCVEVVNLDCECGTLVEEGSWIFAGLRDMIKAWHRETKTAITIRACGGLVNAIDTYEGTLFAGMEDGVILSWKLTSNTSFSEETTSLKGHTGSVLCLIVGAKKLFSGSTDRTIRVWDAESLECKQVLNGHTGDVTSVICWDQYLLSGSLDKTIEVWGVNETGNIEQVYKHDVDNGVVAFHGMHDAEGKPILLCSCKGSGVWLYDLPLFAEVGRMYSRDDITSIRSSPEGLFFTGDAAGLISVWKPKNDKGEGR